MTDSRLRMLALEGIERRSEWITIDARELVYNVKYLAARPAYETMAHDAMCRAAQHLTEALATVHRCMSDYSALPVEEKDDAI